MNEDRLVASQIGVGYWGPNLLRNLVASPKFDVRCVVDGSEGRRAFVKSLYPAVTVANDFSAILEDRSIDLVVIATPVFTHYDFAIKALNCGKHVLVEKPMAGSAAEVEAIGKLAAEKGLVAMVGHTFLYNAAVRYIKNLIDAGDLGDIRYIYSCRLNLGRIRSDVDALWNFAPHDISIIQYLLGNPSPIKIQKQGIDYIQKGIDDVVFLNLEYPGKILANIHVSWLDPLKVRCMTIVGARKMVVYDDIADNKIAIYDKGIDRSAVLGEDMDYDKPPQLHYNYRFGDVLMPHIQFAEPLKVELDHLYNCIVNKIDCISGPDHALKVVKILAGDL